MEDSVNAPEPDELMQIGITEKISIHSKPSMIVASARAAKDLAQIGGVDQNENYN